MLAPKIRAATTSTTAAPAGRTNYSPEGKASLKL